MPLLSVASIHVNFTTESTVRRNNCQTTSTMAFTTNTSMATTNNSNTMQGMAREAQEEGGVNRDGRQQFIDLALPLPDQ